MPDSGVTPPIQLGLKALAAIVVAALTLSGLYWKNNIEISHLTLDMQTVMLETEKQQREIRELQKQVAVLESKQK